MSNVIPVKIPPTPVPAGDLCSLGWNETSNFGRGPTPSEVEVEFSQIQKGPNWVPADGEPLNLLFSVPQFATAPCLFLLPIGGVGSVSVQIGATTASMALLTPNGTPSFLGFGIGQDALVVSNELSDHFVGGVCVVTLPEVL